MSSTRTIVAAVSGIALGTLLGILIAPASGRETRKKIRRGTNDLKDTLAYRCLQAEEMVAKLRKQAGSDPAARSRTSAQEQPA